MGAAPLFHRLYGDALPGLPAPIVTLHDTAEPRVWRGEAQVGQGDSFAARLLCRLLGFPPAAEGVKLTVAMEPDGEGEIWRRAFGVHPMTTRLRPGRVLGIAASPSLSPRGRGWLAPNVARAG